MSNNRNNNRRRGRGNNRSQGGGQLNRIDSRARGNAPQLLEKYKKLAHDASMNGDRVQAEYYLQFADHYFRVIADSRAMKDEQRSRHQDRDRGDDEDYFEDEYDRAPRQDRGRREEQASEEASEEREGAVEDVHSTGAEGDEYEPAENPFTRPARAAKPRRPRKERAPKASEGEADYSGGLDPAALPPAIGRDESADAPAGDVEEPAPAPRRRRTTRARSSGGDQELEAVG
ncbi:DUF4167 domain-containing protein [Altererythrobacter fulvus]|uniref:DUF4167 domain-containing protein n=1 Tax=Caenibius fulvus TaxID=2126012 RepID=UPI00301631C9